MKKAIPSGRPKISNKKGRNLSSSSATRPAASGSQRKASTPTHDKPTRTESPDVSRIMPAEFSVDSGKQVAAEKPITGPTISPVTGPDDEIDLADQIDFEYTRCLQTMFRRKLAEARASEVDDNITVLQKRITENQNILQKTTERLKNINFNKEVETLHRLRNPNYGRVLETLDNANCKEHLESLNRKLEQRQNQLRMKNVELGEGGSAELLQIMKDTVASCEKLKANKDLEVPKMLAEIKANNNSATEVLSRCLELVPDLENLIVDRAVLEICEND